MLNKPLSDVSNRRLQGIMEHVGRYKFTTKHIEGQKKKYLTLSVDYVEV